MEIAIDNATSIITGNSGGYVILHSSTGQKEPDEILIMDTADIKTAQKVWRWNRNGLGYSSNGYNGPYSLAATSDGAIVADMITAGTFDGTLIKAGTVQAGSISQAYKDSVTVEIGGAVNDASVTLTQAFQAADGVVKSEIQQEVQVEIITATDALTDDIDAVKDRVLENNDEINTIKQNYVTSTTVVQTATEVATSIIDGEVRTLIRETAEGIEIGKSDSEYTALYSNQGISYRNAAGVEVASYKAGESTQGEWHLQQYGDVFNIFRKAKS